MILKNARIYFEGNVLKGAILINDGIIKTIIFDREEGELDKLIETNKDQRDLDCQNKLILPFSFAGYGTKGKGNLLNRNYGSSFFRDNYRV